MPHLVHCPMCQHSVSTKASSCPKCGYVHSEEPVETRRRFQTGREFMAERKRRAAAIELPIVCEVCYRGSIYKGLLYNQCGQPDPRRTPV